ncbi:MAG: PKD domain-containing protein, partial [Bacteroidetes bacterium]|nr:PKD domain-containing protein [Bacteroidota bacterium]
DPAAPVNDSPNNTGVRVLPPAQSAFIWYPYGPSEEFPLVGDGGRNAMAGPVFYYDDYEASHRTFPKYYDGKLFIYDWMRDWIMAVTMDENGDFVRMERFMPNMEFSNPMDMLFGPDGVMVLLEYGSAWNQRNEDARLVRIEYTSSNRAPVIVAEADPLVGATPLTVAFSASASRDPEGKALIFAWDFEGTDAVQSTDAETSFTFEQPGRYKTRLTVTDADGREATSEIDIRVGNDAPEVTLEIDGNRTFFWDNGSFAYNVVVTDTEDGSLDDGGIAPEHVTLTFDYLAQGADLALPAQGHREAMEGAAALVGKAMIEGSDCQACHQSNAASIGPSYTAIAQKYEDDEGAPAYLAEKIIQGGGGVWGDQGMAAHPQLSEAEAAQMVRYILSLADEAEAVSSAPLRGVYATTEHGNDGEEGHYIIVASYRDRGAAGIGPLTGRDAVLLRPPRLQAETFDASDADTTLTLPENYPRSDPGADIVVGVNNTYIAFDAIDLTDVSRLTASIGLQPRLTTGGRIDVRLNRPEGPRVGTFTIEQTEETMTGFRPYTIDLMPIQGVFDLVFVFINEDNPEATDPVCGVDWIYFHHKDGP